MHSTHFYLIGTIIFLLGVIVVFKFSNQKYRDQQHLSENIQVNNFSNIITPYLSELLELEKVARKQGTRIELDSLLGIWKFKSVWKKDTDKDNTFISLLLRNFSASLHIDKLREEENDTLLKLSNSISFGLLALQFLGKGASDSNFLGSCFALLCIIDLYFSLNLL